MQVQVPPRPLTQALAGFLELLRHEYGQKASIEEALSEFAALLSEEIGNPLTLLTRKRLQRAIERATDQYLAARR